MRIEHIGDSTLYLADCLEVLPTLGKVDAVVTDPPYGVGLGEHESSKETRMGLLRKQGYDSYEDTHYNFVIIILPILEELIENIDRCLIFCAGTNIRDFPRPDNVGGVYIPSACGRNKWGYTSISHCLMYGQAPNLNRGAKATGISCTDSAETNGHPCPKPIKWMEWAVNLASLPAETILDPFMGSGTTGVACANLGRKFIGIEIEEKYFDIACKRIEIAYQQPRLFDEPKVHYTQAAFV